MPPRASSSRQCSFRGGRGLFPISARSAEAAKKSRGGAPARLMWCDAGKLAKVSFAQNRRTRRLYQLRRSRRASSMTICLKARLCRGRGGQEPFGGAVTRVFGSPFERGGFRRNLLRQKPFRRGPEPVPVQLQTQIKAGAHLHWYRTVSAPSQPAWSWIEG